MGGLVVKKVTPFASGLMVDMLQAIIDAYNDRNYVTLLRNIKGIIFLGTPHRGANLAILLRRILTVTFSKRLFVNQLLPNCETLMEINTAFRNRATSLDMISFYESLGMRGTNGVCPFSTHLRLQLTK